MAREHVGKVRIMETGKLDILIARPALVAWGMTFFCLGVMATRAPAAVDPLDQYNVVWEIPGVWYGPPWRETMGGQTRPEEDASMPIGNGDIGLNVWTERGGDLLFNISKTDAWGDNGRLLKLGRVRIKLTPHGVGALSPFRQELKLRQGEIEFTPGQGDNKIRIRLWVDAHDPVIRLEIESAQDTELQVSFETWRDVGRKIESTTFSDIYARSFEPGAGNADEKNPYPTVAYPDVIVPGEQDRIVWFHHNVKSGWPVTMKVQGLAGFMDEMTDPLLGRTFGGAIKGQGMISINDRTLTSSQPQRKHHVSIYALTQHPATVTEWTQELDETIVRVEAKKIEEASQAHQEWWNDFWNRSWIRIGGDDEGIAVSKAYTLFRYTLACSGRTGQPIKFNGSIFTWSFEGDPDYRQWGPGYWWQNQRLVYWPMIASGDFDLMKPFFKMYTDILPLAKFRTKTYYGHDGAHYPECLYFWGTDYNADYGWDREGKQVADYVNPYIRYEWQGGLELLAIMLDYYAYTEDREFLKEKLLPMADAIITFYHKHYERDAKGKLRIWPAQALETWWECTNPMPEVAGLTFILPRLLALPSRHTTGKQRGVWKKVLDDLPPIPTRQVDGQTILSPAEKFAHKGNVENPELYAVFPYRLYGAGKPDLEMARLTFEQRLHREGNHGHDQDDAYAAYLGLTKRAREFVTTRLGPKFLVARFPTMWHGGYDWPPDFCHGGNGMIALQAMLMQCEGEKIRLFPAWPREWDVEFKLHAPQKTTVEGTLKDGKLTRLTVTPKSREKDVVGTAFLEAEPTQAQIAKAKPAAPAWTGAGSNRLTYLDLKNEMYYPSLQFPRLVTPQWVGKEQIESVAVLSIDDLGLHTEEHYEAYLRPILDRLKQIDGKAPVSIITNQLKPAHPILQTWISEGVNLAAHSFDHPCPCIDSGGVEVARQRYNGCLDQLCSVPGAKPVAYRFGCCDGGNTPSPRAFDLIFNRTTDKGNFLTIDTSVMVVLDDQDPELPRDLVVDRDGRSKFHKYLPAKWNFTNYITNYPYPYTVGRLCWEFPVMFPDDYNGYRVNRKYYDSLTWRDMKVAVETVLIKQGTFVMLFHPNDLPHGWIYNHRIVQLIDYIQEHHGDKMEFLTYRQCQERIDENMLSGQPLRAANGEENGVRMMDLDDDGYLDVVIGNENMRRTRRWLPDRQEWVEEEFPVALVKTDEQGHRYDSGVCFGVLDADRYASLLVRNEDAAGLWHFDGKRWVEQPDGLAGLEIDGQPVFTNRQGRDQGVRLRDLDNDGRCEVLVSNPRQQAVFSWSPPENRWEQLETPLPENTLLVDDQGRDAGLRFVDLNGDGYDDIVFSNDQDYCVHVFVSLAQGWQQMRAGKQGEEGAVPMIVHDGASYGAWFKEGHMWLQNETTGFGSEWHAFSELLGEGP